MLPISDAFRDELKRSIRRPSHVRITLNYKSGGTYDIPESTVESVEFHGTGDPLSRSLPAEECTIVMIDYTRTWDPSNENGLYWNMEEGAAIGIAIGIETGNGTEWSDGCGYITKGSITWDNYRATFHGIRELQTFLSEFHGLYNTDTTLGHAALSILWSGYPRDWRPISLSVYIADSLHDFPIINHANLDGFVKNDALLAVAFAGNVSVKTKHDGTIQLRDFWRDEPEYNAAIIDKDNFMEVPAVEKLPLAAYELVNYLENPDNADRVNVLDISGASDITENDEPVFFRFTTPIVPGSLQFTAQSNIKNTFYYVAGRSGITVYTLERTDTTQDWTLTVTGLAQNPVKKQRYVPVYGQNDTLTGTEVEEIDNPLLNGDTADTVGAFRGDYLRRTRTLYTFQYRGDPSIEALDKLRVDLPLYGPSMCIVVEYTFRFGNGFSGTLSVRKIDKPTGVDYDELSGVADYGGADFALADNQSP